MYYKKIYWLLIGKHNRPAVAALLMKNRIGWKTLHLLALSILVIRVLNLDLPSLAPSRTGNFLNSRARKKSGMMIEVTKKA